MVKRVEDLARLVNGDVIGDKSLEITGARGVNDCSEGDITFAEKEDFLKIALKTPARAVITCRDFDSELLVSAKEEGKALILVDKPRLAYARIAGLFQEKPYYKPVIDSRAFVAEDASLGEDVSVHPLAIIESGVEIGRGSIIGPGVFVGRGSKIGEDVILHPGVVIEHDVQIGDRVEIQAGTVVGSDGFGYVSDENGHHKIPQQGTVIIEDDVEIGALVAIDRAASGATIIRRGTKIDNQVQIGHGVEVGEENIIVAQTGIAGSSKLGKRITLAGRSGVIGHIRLEDGVTLAAGAIATKDITEPGIYSGFPAQQIRKDMRSKAALRRLPLFLKKVSQLEEELKELKDLLDIAREF